MDSFLSSIDIWFCCWGFKYDIFQLLKWKLIQNYQVLNIFFLSQFNLIWFDLTYLSGMFYVMQAFSDTNFYIQTNIKLKGWWGKTPWINFFQKVRYVSFKTKTLNVGNLCQTLNKPSILLLNFEYICIFVCLFYFKCL